MTFDLKTRLLEVAGALTQSNTGHARKGKNHSGSSKNAATSRQGQGQEARRCRSLSEEEILERLQGKKSKSGGRGNPRLRRQFLHRLATALHSYGNSASRTEYLIEKAANRLDVEVSIAVFPALILLNFPGCGEEEDAFNVITVESELDVDKLGRVDHLANHVGKKETPLLLAYWRLKAIATSAPEFGEWWWRLFGYSLSAAMSALLFFNGSLWDGLLSLPLGFVVGIFDLIASSSPLFASVLEFVTALVVAAIARLLSLYLKDIKVCFFSMVLASLVQLLPGLSLTLGVSEMVAKAHVTGTSRIMYALFSALQLGFGIAVGENLAFWEPLPPTMTCDSPNLSIWWSILWFAGFSVASNVLLNARLDQWPGMIVTSGVGYIVSTAAALRLGADASSVIAAFAVGITGTAYSQFQGGDLPLVMVLSGILLLVPGGIGVQGVAAMLQDDVLSGMAFVFDMLVVGLSITLGLLMAKIALPAALFGVGKTSFNNKNTLAAQLEDDNASDSSSDEEENMAI